MTSILTKLGFPTSLGVFVTEHDVTVTQITFTPFGSARNATHREPVGPGGLADVLERQLGAVIRHGRRRVPITVGLPCERVFFSTRPIQPGVKNPSPQVLLREALHSSGASVERMAVDVIQSRPGSRPVASIVSCDKKYLDGVLSVLKDLGFQRLRVEPAPCALLRAATRQHPRRSRTKICLHVFLGETQGLAVLAGNDLPILWRLFEMPKGDEATAILAATRSIHALRKHCGVEADFGAVLLHGRSELKPLVHFDWLQEQIGVKTEWTSGPAFHEEEISHGLALANFTPTENALNLSKTSAAPELGWESFPWRTLAYQTLVLVCMSLFLFGHLRKVSASYQAVRTQNAQTEWLAPKSDSDLDKEHKDLQTKLDAIHKFLKTRVVWSAHTQRLVENLPDSLACTFFQGVAELPASGTKKEATRKTKKSFVVSGEAPISDDGRMPKDLDRFVDALRADRELKRDFPVIELSGLKSSESRQSDQRIAEFTVVCEPKDKD